MAFDERLPQIDPDDTSYLDDFLPPPGQAQQQTGDASYLDAFLPPPVQPATQPAGQEGPQLPKYELAQEDLDDWAFTRGLKSGWAGLESLGNALHAGYNQMIGDETAKNLYVQKMLASQAEAQAYGEGQNTQFFGEGGVTSDWSKLPGYAAFQFGAATPTLLPGVLTGGVGALGAKKLGQEAVKEAGEAFAQNLRVQAGEELTEQAIKEATEKYMAGQMAGRMAAGSGAGTYASSFPMLTGETYQKDYMDDSEAELLSSVLGGAGAAALDVITPMSILKKMGVGDVKLPGDELPGYLTRAAKDVFGLGAKEAVTEAGQELVTGFASGAGTSFEDVREAGAAGFFGGAPWGFATAAGRGRAAVDPETMETEARAATAALGGDALQQTAAAANVRAAMPTEQGMLPLATPYEPTPPVDPNQPDLFMPRPAPAPAPETPQQPAREPEQGMLPLSTPYEQPGLELTPPEGRVGPRVEPPAPPAPEQGMLPLVSPYEPPTPPGERQIDMFRRRPQVEPTERPAPIPTPEAEPAAEPEPFIDASMEGMTDEDIDQADWDDLGSLYSRRREEQAAPTQTEEEIAAIPDGEQLADTARAFLNEFPKTLGLEYELTQADPRMRDPNAPGSYANARLDLDSGRVILDAQGLRQSAEENGTTIKAEAYKALRHEAVNHYGLREVLGDAFEPTMRAIHGSRNITNLRADIVDVYADQIEARRAAGQTEAEIEAFIGDEMMAATGENVPERGAAFKRFISAMKRGLRKAGLPTTDMTEQELVDLARLSGRKLRKPIGGSVFTREQMEQAARAGGDTVERMFSRRKPRKMAPEGLDREVENAELTAARKDLQTLADKVEGAFRTPVSDGATLEEVVADTIGGDAEVAPNAMRPAPNGDRFHIVTLPGETLSDEKAFMLTENPRQKVVHVNTVMMDSGKSEGWRAYVIAGNYAKNKGYKFVGDPGGVSVAARIRRNEHYLSLALKMEGDTSFLLPSDEQLDPTADGKVSLVAEKIEPLRWREGDNEYNLNSLLRTSYNTLRNYLPEIENIQYDRSSERFIDGEGETVTDEQFKSLAKQANLRLFSDIRNSPVAKGPKPELAPVFGPTTLKRAAFTSGRMSGMTELSRGQINPQGENKSLREILYSRRRVTDDTAAADRFADLAEGQRGEPEAAMLRAQNLIGGGVMSFALEHAGDLTHRMADQRFFRGGFDERWIDAVKGSWGEKVRKLDDRLHSPYRFEREFEENLRSNYRYNLENTEGFARKYRGYTGFRSAVDEALEAYADAHLALEPQNRLQHLSQQLAVQLGRQKFDDARAIVTKLREALESPDINEQLLAVEPDVRFSRNVPKNEIGMYSPTAKAIDEMNLPEWKGKKLSAEEKARLDELSDKLASKTDVAGEEEEWNQLRQKMQGQASGKAIWAKLQSLAGKGEVSKEEMEWVGVEEYLQTKDKFTRSEVANFVERNGVQVTEIVADTDEDSIDGGIRWNDGEVWDDSEAWEYMAEEALSEFDSGMSDTMAGDADEWLREWIEDRTEELAAELDLTLPQPKEQGRLFEDETAEMSDAEYITEIMDQDPKIEKQIRAMARDDFDAFANEQAKLSYLDDPLYIYSPTNPDLDLFIFGNNDQGYSVRYGVWHNSRNVVRSDIWSLNEAAIQAEDFAREEGLLEDTDPDQNFEIARWAGYITEGMHQNYREIKLHLPDNPGEEFIYSGHFGDEPNIVTFLRVTDRDNGDTFFIDEFQSDWHQQGRKQGYDTPEAREEYERALEEFNRKMDAFSVKLADNHKARDKIIQQLIPLVAARIPELPNTNIMHVMSRLYDAVVTPDALATSIQERKQTVNEQLAEIEAELAETGASSSFSHLAYTIEKTALEDLPLRALIEYLRLEGEYNDLIQERSDARMESPESPDIPPAPFKGDGWIKLGLKRAFIHAVNQGADKFAWADGNVVTDRWSEDYRTGFETHYDKKMPSFATKLISKLTGKKPRIEHTDLDGMPLDPEGYARARMGQVQQELDRYRSGEYVLLFSDETDAKHYVKETDDGFVVSKIVGVMSGDETQVGGPFKTLDEVFELTRDDMIRMRQTEAYGNREQLKAKLDALEDGEVATFPFHIPFHNDQEAHEVRRVEGTLQLFHSGGANASGRRLGVYANANTLLSLRGGLIGLEPGIMGRWQMEITPEMRTAVQEKGFSLFSRRLPPRVAQVIEETQGRAVSDMGPIEHARNSIRKMINVNWTGVKQSVFDSFHSIKAMEKGAHGRLLDAAQSAYKMAIASRGTHGMLTTALHKAMIQFDGQGFRMIRGSKSFIKVFEPLKALGHENVLLWESWAAAKRAERLLAEGREENWNQQKIDIIRNEVRSRGLEVLFDSVHRDWITLNNQVLELGVASGLLTQETADTYKSTGDYVPFFRQLADEEEKILGPRGRFGLTNQSFGDRRLTGRDLKTGALLENMIMGMTRAIDGAAKNVAAQRTLDMATEVGVAEEIEGLPPGAGARDIVTIKREGKNKHYRVHDELLLRAIGALGPDTVATWIKVLGMPKRWLTTGVTAAPSFMLANYIRDTLSTLVTVKGRHIPILDSAVGAMQELRQSDEVWEVMASGYAWSDQYRTDPSGVRREIKKLQGDTYLDAPAAAWRAWQRVGRIFEQANRLGVRRATLNREPNASQYEADYQAQDVLNFGMRGDSQFMTAMAYVLPFFNARVQGLYRLGRGMADDPVGFGVKGSVLFVASMMLAWMNDDDDDYEALPEWEKDLYWHFFGDKTENPTDRVHVRIPKPFEVGLIFGTVPERITRRAQDKDTWRTFNEAMRRGVFDTLAFNPFPQAVRPALEVYVNKNMFLGRPITQPWITEPKAQFDNRTSELAIKLAHNMPDSAPEWMRSPQKLDHLVRGYFGSVGMFATTMASEAMRAKAGDRPERPTPTLSEFPAVGRFIRTGRLSNRYVGEFYEMEQEASGLYQTINQLRKNAREAEASELQEEKRDILRARKPLTKVRSRIQKLNKRINQINASRTMTGDEKREAIDKLTIRKNAMAERMYERFGETFER